MVFLDGNPVIFGGETAPSGDFFAVKLNALPG